MEETKLKTPEEIRIEIFEAVTEMAKTKPKWILWTTTDWLNWSFKIKKDIEALTDTCHAADVPDETKNKIIDETLQKLYDDGFITDRMAFHSTGRYVKNK